MGVDTMGNESCEGIRIRNIEDVCIVVSVRVGRAAMRVLGRECQACAMSRYCCRTHSRER